MLPREDMYHGSPVGTHFFASPEQILLGGGAADARSDVWSFGALAYFAYEHRPPIYTDEKDQQSVMCAYQFCRPLAMRDERLGWIVGKALQWNPSERFQTMAEMKSALAECWKDELGTGVPE